MKSVRLRVTTSPAVAAKIDSLVDMGLYGRNRNDVAERLICRALQEIFPGAPLIGGIRPRAITLAKSGGQS